jgi:hypothetical protein
VEQAVGQGDGQHRVVGEAAAGVEEREVGRLDVDVLVDRPDDVSGDSAQHGDLPASNLDATPTYHSAWFARATPPAMQASVSLSPPSETASRTACSKSSDSRKARIACGTLPRHDTSNS